MRGAQTALGYPHQRLDVAQATRTFLDVGFELVGGVVEFQMAGLLCLEFRFEELARWPYLAGSRCLTHRLVGETVPGNQARFQQGRGNRHVALSFARALLWRAYAVTEVQPRIP